MFAEYVLISLYSRNLHKYQLSHGSEYNMANIFRISHILPNKR